MLHISRSVRRGRRAALRVGFAVLTAVLVLAMSPGSASAANGAVKPVLDCYSLGADGYYTLVFGYTNTGPSTSIPHGSFNSIVPTALQGKQPTTFATGTRHGVFTLRVHKNDVNGGYWYLDYNAYIFYNGVSVPSGKCPSGTQMPADGNGTGLAIALLASGVLGALFVRRAVRRAGVARSAGATRSEQDVDA